MSKKADELKAQDPETYSAILSEGKKAGIAEGEKIGFEKGRAEGIETGASNENSRIKRIEALSMPGAEAIIAEHKFDRSKTAEQVAVIVCQKSKDILAAQGSRISSDAQELAALTKGTSNTPSAIDANSEIDAAIENAKKFYAKK